MRLRSGIFRALVGILSAVIFTFFFLTVAFDVYSVSVFRSRDQLLQDTIAVTDAIASERVWATIVIGTDGRFGKSTFANRTSEVDKKLERLRKDRDNTLGNYERLNTAIQAYDDSGIVFHRDKVLNLSISGEASLKYYTTLNRFYFDFLRRDSFTNIEASSRRLLALVRINMLHEYSSEERGALSFLILSGSYRDDSVYSNIIRILSNKDAIREELELLLEHDDEDLYNEILNNSTNVQATNITDSMRTTLLDAHVNNASFNLNVGHWFNNMSIVVDMMEPLHKHIFDKHEALLRTNFIYFVFAFVLALIGLIIEVIACTLLIYLAWPVLKLFWTMEGKAKKVSSTKSSTANSTDHVIDAMPTPEVTRTIKKHNTLELVISDSTDTEISSLQQHTIEEQDMEEQSSELTTMEM